MREVTTMPLIWWPALLSLRWSKLRVNSPFICRITTSPSCFTHQTVLHWPNPLKGSSSPLQRCTGVPQASIVPMTDSCPPTAPSSRQSFLSAWAASSSPLQLCSSVMGCKNWQMISCSAYLVCPTHSVHAVKVIIWLFTCGLLCVLPGPCPRPYFTSTYLFFLTSPQPLQNFQTKAFLHLQPPCAPPYIASCRSVSTLGNTPDVFAWWGPTWRSKWGNCMGPQRRTRVSGADRQSRCCSRGSRRGSCPSDLLHPNTDFTLHMASRSGPDWLTARLVVVEVNTPDLKLTITSLTKLLKYHSGVLWSFKATLKEQWVDFCPL